jgi:hypothetical protein
LTRTHCSTLGCLGTTYRHALVRLRAEREWLGGSWCPLGDGADQGDAVPISPRQCYRQVRGARAPFWQLNEAVRGVPIGRRQDRDKRWSLDVRSAVSLHPHKLHGHSRAWRSCRRLLVMRTVKKQAAQARAAGLKRFIADRPCRHGHMERRADDKGTCLACSYLRLGPLYDLARPRLARQPSE